jgi:hypothetical protein
MKKAAKVELVPPYVSALADAYEAGKSVMGGPNAGKTWAATIAFAKEAKKPAKLSRPGADQKV